MDAQQPLTTNLSNEDLSLGSIDSVHPRSNINDAYNIISSIDAVEVTKSSRDVFTIVPDEILVMIIDHCSKDDLKRLRATSSCFRWLTTPIIFKSIRVSIDVRSINNIRQLSRPNDLVHFVKELIIDPEILCDKKPRDPEDCHALRKLKRSSHTNDHHCIYDWLDEADIDYFASLERRDVQLALMQDCQERVAHILESAAVAFTGLKSVTVTTHDYGIYDRNARSTTHDLQKCACPSKVYPMIRKALPIIQSTLVSLSINGIWILGSEQEIHAMTRLMNEICFESLEILYLEGLDEEHDDGHNGYGDAEDTVAEPQLAFLQALFKATDPASWSDRPSKLKHLTLDCDTELQRHTGFWFFEIFGKRDWSSLETILLIRVQLHFEEFPLFLEKLENCRRFRTLHANPCHVVERAGEEIWSSETWEVIDGEVEYDVSFEALFQVNRDAVERKKEKQQQRECAGLV